MVGRHLNKDDGWHFVLFQPLGVSGVAMVSHDTSVALLTTVYNSIGSFVYLVPFTVKTPNKAEVDEFVHWELKDSASVISSYERAHLVVVPSCGKGPQMPHHL